MKFTLEAHMVVLSEIRYASLPEIFSRNRRRVVEPETLAWAREVDEQIDVIKGATFNLYRLLDEAPSDEPSR